MKSPEKMGVKAEKEMEEKVKTKMELSKIEEIFNREIEELPIDKLIWAANKLTNEVEHSWQLEYDLSYKGLKEGLEKNRERVGRYLIEKAKNSTGAERIKALQSLNQVFDWTSLKSEDIDTTDEERRELWEKAKIEKKSEEKEELKNMLKNILKGLLKRKK